MSSFYIENFIKDSVRELKAYNVNEIDQNQKALKLLFQCMKLLLNIMI